jgi:hypothetical protein
MKFPLLSLLDAYFRVSYLKYVSWPSWMFDKSKSLIIY